MPDPDALWRDMQKLDDLYEELLWEPDDDLQFTHDGEKVLIINRTKGLDKTLIIRYHNTVAHKPQYTSEKYNYVFRISQEKVWQF